MDVDAGLRRLEGRTSASLGCARGRIAIELPDERWTLEIEQRIVHVREGAPRCRRPTTRIVTDRATLGAMVRGETCGVHAFLDGRLATRGNLALALQLEDLFEDAGRSPAFPRPRVTHALGIRTFYLDAGAGPPIVLLHGLGGTNASMLPVIRGLAARHRVIAPDLPGFGDSEKPLRRYTARFYARWLAAFLDAVGVERAHLVGNSMGGRIALEAALEHPARVDRLVLLAPAMAFLRYRHGVPLVRALLPELAMLVPFTAAPTRAVLRGLFARPDRLPDAWMRGAADELARVMRSARARVAFFSAARQLYLDEPFGARGLWTRLPALTRPALFVWGARDRLVPARFARHVTAALPTATSLILDDCGHVPQFELPERTNALIADFVR